ncbi:MAG TPA: YcaO-like family protein [Stellaceae bacterium]
MTAAGTRDHSALARVLDEPSPKSFRRGTHRTVAPAETLARVRPQMPRMGITRLGNVTGLDRIGIPVWVAVRPNSRSVSVSQGKGLEREQAMASALMEAAEGFLAEEIGECRVCAYPELPAENTVDSASLCAGATPFDPGAEIGWIEGWDLMRREPCWLPAEIVHTDYTRPPDGHFLAGSNGLASGNHLLEAIGAAICELVERDAVALWTARSIGEKARFRLDIASIDDPDCRTLLQRYDRAGIAVRLWDVTSDIGIPAFLCDIRDLSGGDPHRLCRAYGAGCHPDRSVALARALTEAAQTRLTYITGIRDDLSPEEYAEPPDTEIVDALLDALCREGTPVLFGATPSFAADDLREDVLGELARLRAAGFERVVAVDLTRVDFAIPVVRVVIPGLEYDINHPGYTPGPRARRVAGPLPSSFPHPRPPPFPPPAGEGQGGGHFPTRQPGRVSAGCRAMKAVIFAGPSLPPRARPADPRLDWRPPARQGDVYRAALERPAIIGLIDGYFEIVPSVWHKEILWAMAEGIHVYGAASTGALRAAELAAFGMKGVGKIFEAFRDGTLEDDDEVAILHGPSELGYPTLTEAMVNIRATLEKAVAQRVIEWDMAGRLRETGKALFYKERTYAAILRSAAERGLPEPPLSALSAWLLHGRVDAKSADALAMLTIAHPRTRFAVAKPS